MFVWWKKWQRRQAEIAFRRGYAYAAGELLLAGVERKHETLERLEIEADCPFDFNDFDRGAIAAAKDWRLLVG